MKHLIVTFFLFSNFLFSNEVQTKFLQLSVEKKTSYFKNLDDGIKAENLLFFENEFSRLKKTITDNQIKKEYLLCLGIIYQMKENHIKAITIFNELLNKKKYSNSEEQELEILLKLQYSYQYVNIFSRAISCNKKIDELVKKGVSCPLWEYNYFSQMYYKMKQYDKAIPRLKQEITLLKKRKDRDSLIIPAAYSALGYLYHLNKDNKNALKNFYLSIRLAEKSLEKKSTDYNETIYTIYNNIAFLYVINNELTKANAIYKNHLLAFNKTNEIKYQLRNDLFYANLLLKMNQLEKIPFLIQKIEKSEASAKSLKDLILKLKYDYYKKINDKTSLIAIQDSILKRKDENIAKLEEKNRIGGEINFLIDQNEQNEVINQNKINKKEYTFFIVIIISLSIFLIFILFSIYKNIEKNKKIESLNTSLRQSLKEKDLLLKEIHHRIKNNLQIISGILELQKSTINDTKAKKAIEEGQSRIQSIALVHQYMYQTNDFSTIKVEDFILNLINSIRTSFNNSKIEIKTDIATTIDSFNLNTILPLSLIINEAITNSVKYAFNTQEKGKINITLYKLDNYYHLEISDNGIGFPAEVQNQKIKSIGLDLIEGLSKQLDGNVVFSNNNGAKIRIQFKPI